jgi:hypothetical protein
MTDDAGQPFIVKFDVRVEALSPAKLKISINDQSEEPDTEFLTR